MKLKDRVGEKYFTNQGYLVTIIKYYGAFNCTIEFEEGIIVENIMFGNLIKGNVRNPYHPTLYNIGYLGQGNYTPGIDGGLIKSYDVWANMLYRAYHTSNLVRNATYKDVTVCEEWYNFQNFAQWFENNHKEYMENWDLDKDILVKGNKEYSPQTCVFIPHEINSIITRRLNRELPTGVRRLGKRYTVRIGKKGEEVPLGTFDTPEEAFQAYKIAKEVYIKELADKWKDKLDPRVYEVMYNFQLEIGI